MGEHYTKATKECDVYCTRCDMITRHRVDGGRRGPCLACIARIEAEIASPTGGLSKAQQRRKAKNEKACQNPTLFEVM
jgi:ribosomal protein L44E